MSTAITARLVVAAGQSRLYREQMTEVDWHRIPVTLQSLGYELEPACQAWFDAVMTDSRAWPRVRTILAHLADSISRNIPPYSYASCWQAKAARLMCAELVGVLGGALSLQDMAARIVSEVEHS